MKKFNHFLIQLSLLLTLQAETIGQQAVQAITGHIVDAASSQPLAGATITSKTTGHSTITSPEGVFMLQVLSTADTLVITHAGYLTRQLVWRKQIAQTALVITLQRDAKQLEEIVLNTGLQRLPRERATGSFDLIDNKTFNLQAGSNVLDRLKGVTNAILFDDTKLKTVNRRLGINIRGLSTINGSQDPLIILDNFPYEGDLASINPNDVESISILKDAAAASIWGSKAGNGVIVISTKKGQVNQPLKMEFSSNVIISEKPNLYPLPLMSTADYVEVEKMLFDKGFYNSQINSMSKTALSPAVEVLVQQQNGLLTDAEAMEALNSFKNIDVRDQYSRYIYSRGTNQQYALNLRGGTGKMSYYIGGGYDKGGGSLKESNERISLKMENTYRPVKNMQLSFGLTYTQAGSKSGKPGYGSISVAGRPIPYLQLVDEEGNALPVNTVYRGEYTDTAGGGMLLDWKYYPLEDYKHAITKNNLQNLMINIGFQYQLFKGFTANLYYNHQQQRSDSRSLYDEQSFYARDLINSFSQLDRATGIASYIVPMGGILNIGRSQMQNQNARAQLNFNSAWNRHEISAIAGSEIRQTKAHENTIRAYGYDDKVLTTGTIDYRNSYPNYISGYYSYLPDGISFGETMNRYVSLFANAAYTYEKRYTLSGSMRRDASNLFGVNTNDKWKPFWSAGAAWNISNERFYKSNLFPYLKLRLTYGYSGTVDQSRSALTVLYYMGTDSYTGFQSANINQFANPELRWEKVNTINAGIDFATASRIITGSIEYYRKKGTDLFGPSPIDYTAGLGTNMITKNVADMEGHGIDFSINSKNTNGSIKWTTGLIFNYNTDKITNYQWYGGSYQPTFGYIIYPVKGKSVYSVFSYKTAGLDKEGNPQGIFEGKPSSNYTAILGTLSSPDSLSYNGRAMPQIFGSFFNTFQWKSLALTININYKMGYYFRRSSISYDQLFNSGVGHSDFALRWQRPGDEQVTTVPSMIYPNIDYRDQFYTLSDKTVERGDYIRLHFIHLSYDITKDMLSKLPLESLQLYINASNVGLLWKANKKGLDPDYYSSLPATRNYTIGLRMVF